MRQRRRDREAGIALVLALLALMLLTFLGLTLATTTSTELQIANNYRWSQAAFYNAEAGIEVAKKVLGTANWLSVLPPTRSTTWDGITLPTVSLDGTNSPPNRNYENWSCDARGFGAGYGRVLSEGGTTYSDITTVFGQPINGAFTLWVRRPVWVNPAGLFLDDDGSNSTAPCGGTACRIVTAEGIAPYSDASASGAATLARQNRAVRTMEVLVTPNANQSCGTLGGQVGGGPGGANFGACAGVQAASVGRALGLPGTPAQAQ